MAKVPVPGATEEIVSWARRRGDEIALERKGEQVALFVGESEVRFPNGETWSLIRSDTGLIANLGGGRVWKADPERGRLTRSKNIAVTTTDAAGAEHHYSFVNESKSNWIVDDEAGQKQAQFTGLNSGVRQPLIELEEGHHLDDEEIIFLSWVARVALESRMLNTSTILIIALFIIAPISILIYLI
ncbi:MAG: hypothetical protein Q3962_05650 [Corynebacterium sp.]|nr:hypothetical protein [Corynebacterium sp.]